MSVVGTLIDDTPMWIAGLLSPLAVGFVFLLLGILSKKNKDVEKSKDGTL